MLQFEFIKEGLVVTAMGMSIVFIVLLAIAFILTIFGNIAKGKDTLVKVDDQIELQAEPETFVPDEELVAVITAAITADINAKANYIDDKELVAVITAAIAADTNTDVENLVVRSLRRVNAWNKEAIQEQQR